MPPVIPPPPPPAVRRRARPGSGLVVALVVLATLLTAGPAHAEDIATAQGTTAGEASAATETLVIDLTEGTMTLVGTTRAAAVDPYGSDPNREVGYRWDVCRAHRDGRVELIHFLARQFPAIHELQGYACREIASPGSPDCNGQWEPDHSTCWSTHAAGRAIDVIVGGGLNSPTPAGVALGDEIVTWLLAHRYGETNYWARKMGIQQILWNDRCWSGQRRGDRQVASAAGMRRCGIANHDNHVHLTLSNPGADGLTSWFLELGSSGMGWG